MIGKIPVNKPLAVIAFFIVAVMVGVISLFRLPIGLMPDIALPNLTVLTEFEGASAQDVETMVTTPLERSVGTISGVEQVRSTSRGGNSTINIFFQPGTDMNFAAADVREKIDIVEGTLPPTVSTPEVHRFTPADFPILSVVLYGDQQVSELGNYAENLRREISRVGGVAQVEILGKPNEEILVEAYKDKLISQRISLEQIVQELERANFSFRLGELKERGTEYLVRGLGEFKTPEDIGKVGLRNQSGNPFSLEKMIKIEPYHYEDEVITRFNQQRAIVFQVREMSGANIVQITDEIRQLLDRFQEFNLPSGVEAEAINIQADFILRAIEGVQSAVIMGSILAFLVILFFLGNFRDSFIICTAIPVSVFSTFSLLYISNLTLNLMSLGGLALGAGMLIDNSIVVLESINRHYMNSDKTYVKKPVKDGLNEVAGAITASTLTTVAVFFPIIFMQNFAARIFQIMAMVIAFSLFVSLFVALLLIPALMVLYFRFESQLDHLFDIGESTGHAPEPSSTGGWLGVVIWRGFYPIYHISSRLLKKLSGYVKKFVKFVSSRLKTYLDKAWEKRKIIVSCAFLGLFFVGAGSFWLLPFNLFPGVDSSNFIMNITFAEGVPLQEVDQRVPTIHRLLEQNEYVTDYLVSTGHKRVQVGDILDNRIQIQGTLLPSTRRDPEVEVIMEKLRSRISREINAVIEHNLAFANFTGGAAGLPRPIELKLTGDNLDLLGSIAAEAQSRLQKLEFLGNVENDFERAQAAYQVNINKEEAARYGLDVQTIADNVETSLTGSVPTHFSRDGEEIDIRVRLYIPGQRTVQKLKNIPLAIPSGGVISLNQVVDIQREPTVAEIYHEDAQRVVTVSADIIEGDPAVVLDRVKSLFAEFPLPTGFFLEVIGAVTELQKLNWEIMVTALLSIALVYMTMAGQFNSFLPPFVVMFSVPMAFVGALLGLLIFNTGLSVVSSMGFIVLAGIVVNNAILIVDYIGQIKLSRGQKEACLEAAQIRVRPVFMTTLTTILGLLPLIVMSGEGSALQRPLAIAVAGGLIVSLGLILYLIPLLYGVIVPDVENVDEVEPEDE